MAATNLNKFCEIVRRDTVTTILEERAHYLFTDPPFVDDDLKKFVTRCNLAIAVLTVVGILSFLFSWKAALLIAAMGLLVVAARFLVNNGHYLLDCKRLQRCVVRPAVVVQCYPGGFKPPAEDPDNQLFTGIVVFSFDPSLDGARLIELAKQCFKAKSGPDHGSLADLKRNLLVGDTDYVHETFKLPLDMAGNDQTYASQIMFDRDNDLVDGYLSNRVQLVFAHPEHPEHIAAIPKQFWDRDGAQVLLNP